MKRTELTRRGFLKGAAVATAVPYVWSSSRAKAEAANSQLTIGAIGVGGPGSYARGGKIALNASEFGKVVAVCDVDKRHRDRAKGFVDEYYKNNDCATYNDFRELLERELEKRCEENKCPIESFSGSCNLANESSL